jgi:hypothetical protein
MIVVATRGFEQPTPLVPNQIPCLIEIYGFGGANIQAAVAVVVGKRDFKAFPCVRETNFLRGRRKVASPSL